MDRKELVARLSKRSGYSKIVSSKLLTAFSDVIKECLEEKETVKLHGLGEFTFDYYPVRKVYNFNKGEVEELNDFYVPKFVFSKAVKRRINKKEF